MKSLLASKHPFSDSQKQISFLQNSVFETFEQKLNTFGFQRLASESLDILQINVGKMCNQTCKHCHVDAGPDRKEIMSKQTMMKLLDIIDNHQIKTVDLTGGAPEMNPNFRWFVEELSIRNLHIINRCNLTILTANPKYYDLPDFFAKNQIEIVSSLPHFTAIRTDRQRGEGVFERSINGLKMLNEVGYGKNNHNLQLNLVYNPTGAILPGNQKELEFEYKKALLQTYGIEFNNLFVITNMPVSRFLDYLVSSGNFEDYMEKLIQAFNPQSLKQLMCKNMISISWDGYLYDCDFNQMLELNVSTPSNHIDNFNYETLKNRTIKTNKHCFGCTAGNGSSCGGQIA